jgi:hypothetical protein
MNRLSLFVLAVLALPACFPDTRGDKNEQSDPPPADSDTDTNDSDSSPASDADGDRFTITEGDCDDTDPLVNPAAREACDGVDNNCDGVTDAGTPCFDDDGDGYSEEQGDCDDADATAFPEAPDHTTDGIDQDCNGSDGVDCSTLRYHPIVDGLGQGDCYMGDAPNSCDWNFCEEGYNAISGVLVIDRTFKANLDELWCLCEVGGPPTSTGIYIGGNDLLVDVSALSNVRHVGGGVSIGCNRQLPMANAWALTTAIGDENIVGAIHVVGNGEEYNCD